MVTLRFKIILLHLARKRIYIINKLYSKKELDKYLLKYCNFEKFRIIVNHKAYMLLFIQLAHTILYKIVTLFFILAS